MSSGQDKRKTPVTSSADTSDVRDGGTAANISRGKGRAGKVQGKDRDMGAALRSVYQHTVDESVPDDLLDLLGKLG